MNYIYSVQFSSVAQSCRLFATPWTAASQAPLLMEVSRQEYWTGLPFPTPGDPDPGIEPAFPVDFLLLSHLENPESL